MRLGYGEGVVADVEHLVTTRGVGFAVLAGRFARAATHDELSGAARMWWEAGAPVFAIEAGIPAVGPDDKHGQLAVQLMAARGTTPLVGDLATVPSPLSDRQLEIVTRVLEGESNELIAEELFISRRTVENHLHRVYSTMDITSGRDELLAHFRWIYEPPTMSSRGGLIEYSPQP